MATLPISDKNRALVTEQFAANSISGAVQFLVVSAVYFFTYPLLLKSLGPERFGLWAVLGLPSQYVLLGTFGLSHALIKLVAEDPAQVESDHLSKLAGSVTTVFILVGSSLALATFIWREEILGWLRITPGLVPEARVLLFGFAWVIFMSLLASVYLAVLSGLHRMDLANAIQTVGSAITGVGIVVALKTGSGLVGVMVVYAISAAFIWLTALSLSRRIAGVSWSILPRSSLKASVSLFRFGLYVYVAGLGGMLLEPSLKVLLSRYSGLASVTNFEVASRMLIQVRSLFANVMLPLLPASSLLMNDVPAIRALFGRAMRLLWLTAIPVFVALSGLSAPLLHSWLGRDVPVAAVAMTVLAVGWLFNILTIPSYILVQGMNFPRYATVSSVAQGLISVAGGLWLIPRIGLSGAVLSEAVGLSVAAIYILGRFRKLCPVRFAETLRVSPGRALGVPLGFALLVFVCGFLLRVVSIWQVSTICLGGGLIYAALLFSKRRNSFTAFDFLASYLPWHSSAKKPLDVPEERETVSTT